MLEKEDICLWFLQQVNMAFIKEFVVEGPRTVRYVATSMLIQAIRSVKEVPLNFVMHCIGCLKKSGMTPFGTIFS